MEELQDGNYFFKEVIANCREGEKSMIWRIRRFVIAS